MKRFVIPLAIAIVSILLASASALAQSSPPATYQWGGNITSTSASCVPTACVQINLPGNASVLTVGVTGTFSATLAIEQSQDGGTTWTSAGASLTTAGTTIYTVTGFTNFRVRASAYVSGNAGVNINVSAAVTNSVSSGIGVPSGSCSASQLYVNSSNGNLYACNSGTWTLVSGGGGSGCTPGGAIGDIQFNNGAGGCTNAAGINASAIATISPDGNFAFTAPGIFQFESTLNSIRFEAGGGNVDLISDSGSIVGEGNLNVSLIADNGNINLTFALGVLNLGSNANLTPAGALTVTSCTGCGGGSTPTGTGFVHITAGAQDGAARAVSLATADVTDQLPISAVGSAGLSATSPITISGAGVIACATCTTGSVPFSGITSATNTTAAMVLGSGSSLNVSGSGTNNATTLGGATFAAPGPIGSTTASTGAFSTISATGQITSTLATGTAPLVVASTTNVANLNASSLNGATFAAPGAIGGTTPGSGTFTTLTASGQTTLSGAGAASTPSVLFNGAVFTGGSGTTTFPNVYLNYGTAPTTWVTTGTLLGLNAPSGFTGSYVDIHNNGGASVFLIGNTTVTTTLGITSGGITSSGSITAGAAGAFVINGRSKMVSAADGRMQLLANANGALTRLTFGAETTSFPAFTMSGTNINTTLGDGSAGGTFTAGNIAAMQSCGTTSTCSATAISTNARIVIGSAPLVSGTPSAVTISGISPAFTSSTTYKCTVSDQTAVATALFSVTYVSGSSFTITGGTALTDTVGYICAGN